MGIRGRGAQGAIKTELASRKLKPVEAIEDQPIKAENEIKGFENQVRYLRTLIKDIDKLFRETGCKVDVEAAKKRLAEKKGKKAESPQSE